ncbi:MAG: xylulokinase [Tagaea sp.]|nr:xylulokinase [Tagaea sp.]
MPVYLGLDIGTSSVKGLLTDDDTVLGVAGHPLSVSRPQDDQSEQDPEDWWLAVESVVAELRAAHRSAFSALHGIGLSGQMHGATLLDSGRRVLRPCILWNDGRATAECDEFASSFDGQHDVTGNLAMPGFTAPKLLWVRRHEPDIFRRTAMVLLPKAYVRLRLTGETIEEMSDASGTLWLDVRRRRWSERALDATGLSLRHMPSLVEGTAEAGRLRREIAASWGLSHSPVVAGGAGDNAAGAIGLGAIAPGSAFLSLGTSGVLWATTGHFAPATASAVHAFCHAVPDTWHQMGVTLSAASCLGWWARVTGSAEAELLGELGGDPSPPGRVLFLPYLSGERTPHNDAGLRGEFIGLDHDASRRDMTQAILEGVAFAFRDCLDALAGAGTRVARADVIGGGARSRHWIRILASVLDIPLGLLAGGENGAALGAARLARMAATGARPSQVAVAPTRSETIDPETSLGTHYSDQRRRFRAHTASQRFASK